jgi:hypothetical protein
MSIFLLVAASLAFYFIVFLSLESDFQTLHPLARCSVVSWSGYAVPWMSSPGVACSTDCLVMAHTTMSNESGWEFDIPAALISTFLNSRQFAGRADVEH